MVVLLDETIGFPDPRQGEPDGLFAVGGDLTVERLKLAYSHGIFPWYAFRTEDADPSLIDPETGKPYIQWWCPMDRFVILPEEIHISHSMRQLINKGTYKVTLNRAFNEVVKQCGQLRLDHEGAWLGPEMTEAYQRLHEADWAASVEVWDGDSHLVGGLYGVLAGRCFCGESMFSLVPSASKLALIMLALRLQQIGGMMIDCQFETEHLKSMGGRYMDYDEYLKRGFGYSS